MSNIWATFARKIVANNVQKSPNLLTLNGSFMSLLFSYKQNDDDDQVQHEHENDLAGSFHAWFVAREVRFETALLKRQYLWSILMPL